MPVTLDERVVIGRRPVHWPPTGIPPGSIGFQDGYYGIWKTLPDGSPNTDYPTTSEFNDAVLAWEIDPNVPASQALAERLGNAIAAVSQKLAQLSDAATIPTRAGPMRGDDAKISWQ